MNATEMIFGGAAITGIVAAWGQIKSVAASFTNLFIKKDDIITDELRDDLIRYVRDNYKYFILKSRQFSHKHILLTKINKYGYVGVETFEESTILFFHNKKPIILNTVNNKDNKRIVGHLVYMRGTFDIDNFISSATLSRNEKSWEFTSKAAKRFTIKHCPNIYKKQDGGTAVTGPISVWPDRLVGRTEDELINYGDISKNIDRLLFDHHVYDDIKTIEMWLANKDWYKEKGIPWKTGWLLNGMPGTGKSSLALAMAQKYDLPIFVFNLGQMSSQEFTQNWREMQSRVPCIALIEDFDNIFHGRENISGYKNYISGRMSTRFRNTSSPEQVTDKEQSFNIETELTFDILLNMLDGVERYEGVFTIITTNCLDKVDPAIYSRPGRIDKTIQLGYISAENKIKMAQNILGDKFLEHISIEDLEYLNDTPCQWQEKLVTITLKQFYEQKDCKKK